MRDGNKMKLKIDVSSILELVFDILFIHISIVRKFGVDGNGCSLSKYDRRS